MRLKEKRTINRPLSEVFAYTADFANSSEWDPGVKDAERVDDGPVGVGATYQLDVEFGGKTLPMTYRITDFEPNERVVLVGEGETVRARDVIEFEASGDQTIVDYTADIELLNMLRFLGPLLRPLMNPVGEKALNGLKESLER